MVTTTFVLLLYAFVFTWAGYSLCKIKVVDEKEKIIKKQNENLSRCFKIIDEQEKIIEIFKNTLYK